MTQFGVALPSPDLNANNRVLRFSSYARAFANLFTVSTFKHTSPSSLSTFHMSIIIICLHS